MKWQDLTSPRFARAVADTHGVCIVPLGVVEKHGEHLPLGTDYLFGSRLAEQAADLEPAMVFPPYYFGQIHEARHQPGTIAIQCDLMLQLLENVCQEIARNGMKKIILLNCHGGNSASLKHFLLTALQQPRDFTLYLLDLGNYLPHNDPGWKTRTQGRSDRHAGEFETSIMLAAFPDLVRMDEIGGDHQARERLNHLGGLATSVSWYADFPDHYAGDASFADRANGNYAMDYMTQQVARHIARVKADNATSDLLKEFYKRSQAPSASK